MLIPLAVGVDRISVSTILNAAFLFLDLHQVEEQKQKKSSQKILWSDIRQLQIDVAE
jgi:hypothetical protein